jgi:hypothetical protein
LRKRLPGSVAADFNGYFQIQLVQEADKPLLAETVKLGARPARPSYVSA